MIAFLLAAAVLAPAKTQTVVVHAAQVAATSRVSGSCWTSSIASQRQDAYRCMAANVIYDPCFSIDSRSVACPSARDALRGVRIHLTKPLPQPNAAAARSVWMMRLASGAVCTRGTGTVIPDYPFLCTQNLVCAAPADASGKSAVFVACGHAVDGRTARDVGHYLATAIYE